MRNEERRERLTPHPLLDGQAPIDLAATDLGGRSVEEVLGRPAYGLPV